MDQTQRPADDSGAGRGSSMLEKQHSNLPSGFQPRPQGPPPQRYPINNGSSGPRLGGGQPPPSLPRLDSRSTLGAPTGSPTQFSRPPFGPPRPPGAPPGQFPRGPPPPANPGQIRFPPGSPGVRGPFPPGQRPSFTNNQVRPQRQPSLDPTGPNQPRFPPPGAGFPFNPENRLPTPRVIPETLVINPQGGNPVRTPRESTDTKSPSRPQPKIRMETNGPNLLANQQNDKENVDSETPKKRPSSQTTLADDDDDDDVVMDNEKDSKSQTSASNESLAVPPGIKGTPSPEPRTPVKNETSASPSPASSKAPTPAPDDERSKSRLSDNVRPPDGGDDEEVNEKSRPASAQSSKAGLKSPTKSIARSLDPPLPGPGKRSPEMKSPEMKSPVVGFDNGRPRSLTARSPSPASSPGISHSPKTPGTPKSEKRTTFADVKEGSKTERSRPGTPGVKSKPGTPTKSPTRPQTPKSGMRRSASGRSIKSDGGSDSGANQTTQNGSPTTNGVSVSPTKKLPIKSKDGEKPKTAGSPIKSPSKSVKSLPRTPEAGPPSTADKKKVPMNKVQVGAAPSPNLKTVRSKIGSLDNASYKPGGGKVKIENRKLDFSKAQPKIAAKNDKYMPSGGDKKIQQVKLQWNAKPKVGSLDNATYRPGGGDKKIETVKLDFKDKAKPKVGSKDNAKHVPGGGTIKTSSPNKSPPESQSEIETQKIDIKAESKIGSLDNVKHKPGGGDKKIFNDRDYLRQTSSNSNVESANGSGAQSENESEDPKKPEPTPPPSTPTRSRPSSAASPVTPRAVISSLQARSPDPPNPKRTPTPTPEPTEKQQSTPKGGTPQRSPVSSRPPSIPGSKSSDSSRRSSPGVHLPKLPNLSVPSISPPQNSDPLEIKLPKLIDTSSAFNRFNST